MDRLTSMAVFVASVEEGSMVAAARRFGISASMAGKHVSSLEADLSVRLMLRSTRSLSLTEVGRAYYTRCKRLLEDYDEARREAGDTQATARGVLRIAAPVTFGEMHLTGVISRYMARYPEVSIEIVLDDRHVDLLTEGFDVAIRIGRLRDSELIARRLGSCDMIFCASPAFLGRHGEPKTVCELRLAPRLAFSDAVSTGDWVVTEPDGTCHAIDGPVRLRANNMKTLLDAALAGSGVAYGPGFVFREEIAKGGLVGLLPELGTADLDLHAVYPMKRYVTFKLRKFIDELVLEFGSGRLHAAGR